MECPYCGAELKHDDIYYTGRPANFYGTAANGIYYPSTMEKLGDIFHCPNRNEFEDLDDAERYKKETNNTERPIKEMCCDSNVFNGFFYTDRQGNLKEGYPC